MLQAPETTRRPACPIYRVASPKSKKQKLSALERAIADHKTAARIFRNRTADKQRLYDAHPELADNGPSILVWRNVDGAELFGCCLNDFDRTFPAAVKGRAKARKQFQAAREAALPEFNRQRRVLGISRAETRYYQAWRKEFGAFRRFIKAVPSNRSELRRYTRYLLLAVAGRVGCKVRDRISTTEFAKLGISWKEFQERQRDAFDDLYRALLTLATRA